MTSPVTSNRFADQYLEFLDPAEAQALLACSAAVTLDDETASRVIDMVTGSNGSTSSLVWRVKNLGCVHVNWDGTFHVDDDLRQPFLERLGRDLDSDRLDRVHGLLAREADRRLTAVSPNGALSAWNRRAASLEAAHQKILTRDEAKIAEGGRILADTWRGADGDAKHAVCRAVEALAPEMDRRLGFERLPDEALFLRGMAARRHDRAAARRYFEEVWRRGQKRAHHEDVHAIASHLFGKMVARHHPTVAEEAYGDSLAWNEDPFGKGQVYHSLGNLLARERRRWKEAEDAYRKSLELRQDPSDQGQVYHSLGKIDDLRRLL